MWTSVVLSAALLVLVGGVCQNYEKDYYEEIGCRPETEAGAKCPTSYDCSSVSQRSQDKCHYKGKEYDEEHRMEQIPSAECIAECRCQSSYPSSKKVFNCVHIECPELFMGPPPAGCYRTYEHGKCCHVKQICQENSEKTKVTQPVCTYKERVLQIGEKFYPDEEPCLMCICQPGYNGSFVEPFCKKIHCNLELNYGERIADGCVPVYYGEKSCCPIDWRCPEKSDSVMPSTTNSDAKSSPDSGKTCKFGDLTLHVGEKLSPVPPQKDNLECSCRVPPHPVCIQKENS